MPTFQRILQCILTATGSTAAISDANVNACIALKSIPIFPDVPNRDNPLKEHITKRGCYKSLLILTKNTGQSRKTSCLSTTYLLATCFAGNDTVALCKERGV